MKYFLKQAVDATARGKVRGFARRQDVSRRLSQGDAVRAEAKKATKTAKMRITKN
jgi:hypothetical protein